MSESVLENVLRLGAKYGNFWEPSIPKMKTVESLQPPGHDIGNFSIIYKTNDPQIFHL